jgi:23S rRNA (uracil1939-C5)-methyltransferase
VLQINTCFLQDEKVNDIRNAVYNFCYEHQYSFYNLKYHEGLMRNLIFRNTTLNEWMVTVCFAENDMEKIVSLDEFY